MGTRPPIASAGERDFACPPGSARLGPPRDRHRTGMHHRRNDTDMRIWQAVMSIPPGKVATYGDVACMAGMPGLARRVGRALRGLPEDTRIPWHRVVNARGRIVLPGGGIVRDEQRARLESEGIRFRSTEGLCLREYRWRPE
jgi:methylated-DNA-protein-cysteine methyltransferase-like protein